jgi:hypothetical protein
MLVEPQGGSAVVSPRVVAHRAGNDLQRLAEAEKLGVDVVEADLWFYRGRVEVRHLKRLGPLPFLWDKWFLVDARGPWHLSLEHLLEAVGPDVGLMLDLKGGDPRLARATHAVLRRVAPDRAYSVCSRFWASLATFRDDPVVEPVLSVGRPSALALLPRRLAAWPGAAAVVHPDLLDATVGARLRGVTDTVYTWKVNDVGLAHRVVDWGVTGVIVDDPAVMATLLDERTG